MGRAKVHNVLAVSVYDFYRKLGIHPVAWNTPLKIRHRGYYLAWPHSYTTETITGAPRGLFGTPWRFALTIHCAHIHSHGIRPLHTSEFLGPGW